MHEGRFAEARQLADRALAIARRGGGHQEALAAINSADKPPAVIVIGAAVLGLITLIGAWMAWRHQHGGRATVIPSRFAGRRSS